MPRSRVTGRYWVDREGTPHEKRDIATATWAGDSSLLKLTQRQRDANVHARLLRKQESASHHYEMTAAVVNAPPGMAMKVLETIAPRSAEQI